MACGQWIQYNNCHIAKNRLVASSNISTWLTRDNSEASLENITITWFLAHLGTEIADIISFYVNELENVSFHETETLTKKEFLFCNR